MMAPSLSRRRALRWGLMGLGLPLASLDLEPAPAVAARQTAESVDQFRGNAARTGNLGGRSGPRGMLTEWWRFGAGGPVLSSPAVVDGVVYVGSGGFRPGATTLFAIDAA